MSRHPISLSFIVCALGALGCDGTTPVPEDAPTADTPTIPLDTNGADAPIATDGGTDAATTDAPVTSECGTERPDVSGIRGTEGLIVARDGTIYYSQNGGVGRLAPGGSPEDDWVTLSGTSTIWGLALDAANETLLVGSPGNGRIYAIDLTASTPAGTSIVPSAGQPNGLTVGPDGALYYSDFGGGAVRRVAITGGTPTTVTTSNIAGANGVAFDSDGRLLVASYSSGRVFRLTLTAGAETARETVAMGVGSPDGVALDENGDLWVTDNSGRLLFVPIATGTPMMRQMGISAAASVDFGAGPLDCHDVYVASSGSVVRYAAGVAGADVPWH